MFFSVVGHARFPKFRFIWRKVLPRTYQLPPSKIAFRTPENLVSDPRVPGTPGWEPLVYMNKKVRHTNWWQTVKLIHNTCKEKKTKWNRNLILLFSLPGSAFPRLPFQPKYCAVLSSCSCLFTMKFYNETFITLHAMQCIIEWNASKGTKVLADFEIFIYFQNPAKAKWWMLHWKRCKMLLYLWKPMQPT